MTDPSALRQASFAVVTAAVMASCTEPARPPTRQIAHKLLAALDRAFNEGADEDYQRLFAGGVPRHGAAQRMRKMWDHGRRLRQRSELVDFTSLGDVGVALARTTLCAEAAGALAGPPRTGRDAGRCVAFRVLGRETRILLYVDADLDASQPLSQRCSGEWSCPPCNFSVGTDRLEGWLIVPSPTRVAGCVEMVSFYRPGDDIRLTLSVHRNPHHLAARGLLADLVHACSDEAGATLREDDVLAWHPAFYGGRPPPGVEGALTRPADCPGETLYLVTHATERATGYPDAICYLLTVAGDEASLARHGDQVDLWLASFRLLDAGRPSDEVAYASARAHSGGCELLGDGTYHNPKHRFSCRGPASWTARLRAERGLFGVVYDCPDRRGVLSLTAYGREPGTPEEQRAGVRRLVLRQIRELGLAVGSDPGWHPSSEHHEAFALHVESLPNASGGAGEVAKRLDHVVWFPDLWVWVVGHVHGDPGGSSTEHELRRLIESIRR